MTDAAGIRFVREPLPDRHPSVTVAFQYTMPGAGPTPCRATLGFYDMAGARLGEIFVNAGKVDSGLDVNMRDAAVLVSLALQSGYTLADLRPKMMRDHTGRAEGVIGQLLDLIAEGEGGAE